MAETDEQLNQVPALSGSLCIGAVLTLLAVLCDVGTFFVALAAVATVVTAVVLVGELRKRGSQAASSVRAANARRY
jgi:hypothetical protein